MSNINFFRVLQNATPQTGEQNFNYVASGSAYINGSSCGNPGYYNSQPGEGTPLSSCGICSQIWQDYGSGSFQPASNTKTSWITSSLNFNNNAGSNVNLTFRIFSNGKNCGRLLEMGDYQDTVENNFYTVIAGPDKLGTGFVGTAVTIMNVQGGHDNVYVGQMLDDYENGSVLRASTSSVAYFGSTGGYMADFQFDNITFQTCSVWLSSGSSGFNNPSMTIRQHYTVKQNNPTEIFGPSQVAGDDYKDFILNTSGKNIPNGMNFTNDGFGCVFVFGDGANSYITAVSMSTAYALDTMFKSSSITNITPALTAATTTSGDYTQLVDSFMFRDDGSTWANDKMVLIQHDLANNNTTTAWEPIINNNTQGIEYIGRANPGARLPGYTQPSCNSNQLLGRLWSKPIQWYKDQQGGWNVNIISNQIYCIDQLSGGGELPRNLHIFSLKPAISTVGYCV
jgi:hypothetical protein